MSKNIISVNHLNKRYKNKQILNNISFSANTGEVIGVIGANGAGKSTFLKTLLGLISFDGDVEVCGLNPKKQQDELMTKVSFIADTATLPHWITCKQLLDYMNVIHPNFHRSKAENFIKTTKIKPDTKVNAMSKGMVTQLHLAITMAIKSQLLVLDEPTIGLDVIRRKMFYQQLLDEYFDEGNTIIITTHQIEEIEKILTRVVFIEHGDIIADINLGEIEQRYTQVLINENNHPELMALKPLSIDKKLNGYCYIFQDVERGQLAGFENITIPALSDIFIALHNHKKIEKTDTVFKEVDYVN